MNKLHRLLALVLALALSLSLTAPAFASEVESDGNAATAAAEELEDALPTGTVTGFGTLENNEISLSKKCSLEELTAQMPDTLPVHVDGVESLLEIPVSWVCLDDYESSNEYYFQFSPQWDQDTWPLADGLDVDLDAPYIAVFLDEGLVRSVSSTKAEVFEYLTQNMGLNQAAACGVMANIDAESGFQVTVSAYDGSGSYGLCQWLGSRLTSLKSWCKTNGYDYKTAQGQLHYMEYELSKGYKKVDTYLRKCNNDAQGAYDAAYYWCMYFEIPANTKKQSITRGNLAKNTYWPVYGATLSKTPVLSGVSTPAASIKAGTGVSVYGTIICADKLTKVVAGVYNAKGELATGATVKPNVNHYNLYELDNKILFSALSAGDYTYKIQATTASGTYSLLDYSFTVTGTSSSGTNTSGTGGTASSGESTENETKPAVSVPEQVTGLKASGAKTTSLTLTWTEVAGATSYRVFQSDTYDGTYSKINTVTTNSCAITGLKAGTGYYYKVKAVNEAGVGKASSILSTQTTFSSTTQVTTTSSLKLRAHAGTSYKSQVTVPAGKTLNAICMTKDKNGVIWYKVKYTSGSTSYTGYLHSSWLKVATGSTDVELLITTCNLNLRKSAGVSGSVLKVVPKNTVLTSSGASGNWYKAKYTVDNKSYTGYLSKSYLHIGKRAKTSKAVTLYAKASTSASKVKALKASKKVAVVSSTTVSGTTWYQLKVVSGGKCYSGYCKGTAIAFY